MATPVMYRIGPKLGVVRIGLLGASFGLSIVKRPTMILTPRSMMTTMMGSQVRRHDRVISRRGQGRTLSMGPSCLIRSPVVLLADGES